MGAGGHDDENTLGQGDLHDTQVYPGPEGTLRVTRTPGEPPACVDAFGALPGIVAYRLLTGRLPFTDPNPRNVMRMQAQSIPLRPSRVEPLLPAAFDDVTVRALSKDPNDRPRSARRFLQDLRDADSISKPEPAPTRLTASRLFMVG